MSRIELNIAEMLTLTNEWLTDKAKLAILNAHAEFKALIPRLKAVQASLLAVDTSRTQRLADLTQQVTDADATHDSWIRAIIGVLEGLEAWFPDEAKYPTLLQWMFPNGLAHTQSTYRAEVGLALRIESELADHKKDLAAIKFEGATLLDGVQAYIDAAKALGQIDQERTAADTPTNQREARAEWLHVVAGMIAAGKLVKLSPADKQVLFGSLNAASAKPAKKPAKTKPGPNPAPTPTPTPAPVPNPAPVGNNNK
jgi:hypothetical protein